MEVINVLIGDKWRQFISLLLAGGASAILYAYGIKVVHDTLTSENNVENILLVTVLITVSVGLSIFSGQQQPLQDNIAHPTIALIWPSPEGIPCFC